MNRNLKNHLKAIIFGNVSHFTRCISFCLVCCFDPNEMQCCSWFFAKLSPCFSRPKNAYIFQIVPWHPFKNTLHIKNRKMHKKRMSSEAFLASHMSFSLNERQTVNASPFRKWNTFNLTIIARSFLVLTDKNWHTTF